ncbi:MAG: DUF1287 domain-containing protein [Hyphomonadaceae bacterium]|nr:DUF1287 domain-containing protein [Hyphomonadaceae bacterium]
MTTRRQALAGLLTLPLAPSLIPAGTGLAPEGKLIAAARSQIGVTRHYDPAYVRLSYPGGDVAADRGVCTDVIVRAYRAAFDFDFQKAVHEDMARAFSAYPANWGLSHPDRNIDHRRVPNLEAWLARQGAELPADDWQAGDLFTGRLIQNNLPHIAVMSPRRSVWSGDRLLIHNIGRGTEESDWMSGFKDLRRFRFFPDV